MENTLESRKILVIDDNQSFAKFLRKYLSDLGYSVTVCFDGVSGVEQAWDLLPDLVLTDFSMPGLNGDKVIQALNGNLSTSATPVIMLTGSELGPETLNTLNKCGNFRSLILKPPSLPELCAEIEKAVRP